ncbi:MAG: efflux RND transporter permease subunit [Acidobacteriota bacterium]
MLGGLDIATQTSNSNVATIVVTLKPWEERETPETQLNAILGSAAAGFSQVPEAFAFAFGLPPILGLRHHRRVSSSCWRIAVGRTLPR